MLVHKSNIKNKHKYYNDILDQPQFLHLTNNKMLITQEAHTMNIYQLCGPQEHDDNDNVTSGECCATSKLTSYMVVSLMVRHVTFYIATS